MKIGLVAACLIDFQVAAAAGRCLQHAACHVFDGNITAAGGLNIQVFTLDSAGIDVTAARSGERYILVCFQRAGKRDVGRTGSGKCRHFRSKDFYFAFVFSPYGE